MNCSDIRKLLPEMAQGELSPVTQDLVDAHLSGCRQCAAIAGREQRLHKSLMALPTPKMPADLPARLFRAAREAEFADMRQAGRRKLRQGFSMAASVLLVSGIAFMLGRGSVTDDPAAIVAVNVPLGAPQMVAVKIDAPQAFENVQFEVRLPDNVALENQPNLREFAWSGQLRAGVNVLSLPLVGIREAGGELVARVKFGGTEKSLHVPLSVGLQS